MIIQTNNLNDARKQINLLKKEGKKVIVFAQDDEFNRKIFENKDVDLVIGLEFNKQDFMKQRNSGLNEILCTLAKKNNISIGIDLDTIRKLDSIEKAKVLARIRQNIQLCKRIGTKINFLGDIGKIEIMGFIKVLGGNTKQGIDACLENPENYKV